MNPSLRLLTTRVVPCLALLSLVACGSVPTRTFKIDAIDSDEMPRACLVVIDQDWIGAANKKQFVNVGDDNELTIELSFDKAEFEVGVAPVRVENGVPTSVPKRAIEATEFTGYLAQFRKVRARDAEKQLFIITRK